jgi:hypothetical protein
MRAEKRSISPLARAGVVVYDVVIIEMNILNLQLGAA